MRAFGVEISRWNVQGDKDGEEEEDNEDEDDTNANAVKNTEGSKKAECPATKDDEDDEDDEDTH